MVVERAEESARLAEIDAIIRAWTIDDVFNRARAALADGRRAIALSEAAGDPGRLAWSHLLTGGALSVLASSDDALRHLEQAEDLFRQVDDAVGLAETLLRLNLVLPIRFEYARSFRNLEEALALARSAGKPALEAMILSDLAILHGELGSFDLSVPYYQASMELARTIGDRELEGTALNNLATDLISLGDFAGARAWLIEALELYRSVGELYGVHFPLANLARCAEEAGRLAEARDLLVQACEACEPVGNRSALACCLSDLGRVEAALGDWGGAESAHARAADLLDGIGDEHSRIRAALARWRAAAAAGAITPDLRARLEAALAVAERGELDRTRLDLHEALAEVCQTLGELAAAIGHLRQHARLQNELRRAEAQARAQRLAALFEVERIRSDADRERARRIELAEANAALAAANQRAQELLQELTRQKQLLERQATEDPLTGLANRRYFDAELAREVTRAERYRHPLSLALADIDHFKWVNDRFSHQIGDVVLRQIAAILRAAIRETDIVARYGCEEFVICFPETELDGAVELAERVRTMIADHDWRAIHPDLAVTISLGVTTGRRAASDEGLMAAADAMLYLAKHRGRNQVRASTADAQAEPLPESVRFKRPRARRGTAPLVVSLAS